MSTAPSSPAADAARAADTELTTEFRRLARHLAAVDPTPYQVAHYVQFHRQRSPTPAHAFDRQLLRLSRTGTLGLALADAYTGTLLRTALLRSKLAVTLAILECAPPSFHLVDAPDPGGRAAIAGRMVARTAVAAAALACAIAIIAPVHVWHAVTGGTRG